MSNASAPNNDSPRMLAAVNRAGNKLPDPAMLVRLPAGRRLAAVLVAVTRQLRSH